MPQDNTERRWRKTSAISISLATALCCLLCIPGYMMFRGITAGNLLNNFGADDQVANVTRLVYVSHFQCSACLLVLMVVSRRFSLTMVLTYPMEMFVARHTMNALLFNGAITDKRHYAISLVLWGSSVLIALVVEDLGFVLELTGGVSGTYIGYIMPGMLYLRLADYRLAFWKNKGRVWETARDMAAPVAVVVFGVYACINGTALTLKDAIEEGF